MSSRLVDEIVRVAVAVDGPSEVARLPVERHRLRRGAPAPLATRPLRIVQIADPHLGPWQPVKKLRQQIEALVDHDSDLMLLTGDFLTVRAGLDLWVLTSRVRLSGNSSRTADAA